VLNLKEIERVLLPKVTSICGMITCSHIRDMGILLPHQMRPIRVSGDCHGQFSLRITLGTAHHTTSQVLSLMHKIGNHQSNSIVLVIGKVPTTVHRIGNHQSISIVLVIGKVPTTVPKSLPPIDGITPVL